MCAPSKGGFIKDFMYPTASKKKDIFQEFGQSPYNTGSCEGQIALLSYRIRHLTERLKGHRKDLHTQKALLDMVGKRRRLLSYLFNESIERWRNLKEKLGLR